MKSSTNSKALLSGFGTIRLLLMAFFLVAVIAPVATLVVRLFQPGALAVFSSASFGSALANSIVSALMGTLVSVALALAAAFVLTRRRIGHAEVWVTVLALPMLIPSIAHGMGLVYLFGSNGLVTNLVSGNWNIYGLPGIVLGSTLYAFPLPFLCSMTRCATRTAGHTTLLTSWAFPGRHSLLRSRSPISQSPLYLPSLRRSR